MIGAPVNEGPSPFDVPEIRSLLLHQGVTATKIERARILGNIDLASAGAQADEKGKEYFLSALPEKLEILDEQWAIPILCLLFVDSPVTEALTQNPPVWTQPEHFLHDQTPRRAAKRQRLTTRRRSQISGRTQKYGGGSWTNSR